MPVFATAQLNDIFSWWSEKKYYDVKKDQWETKTKPTEIRERFSSKYDREWYSEDSQDRLLRGHWKNKWRELMARTQKDTPVTWHDLKAFDASGIPDRWIPQLRELHRKIQTDIEEPETPTYRQLYWQAYVMRDVPEFDPYINAWDILRLSDHYSLLDFQQDLTGVDANFTYLEQMIVHKPWLSKDRLESWQQVYQEYWKDRTHEPYWLLVANNNHDVYVPSVRGYLVMLDMVYFKAEFWSTPTRLLTAFMNKQMGIPELNRLNPMLDKITSIPHMMNYAMTRSGNTELQGEIIVSFSRRLLAHAREKVGAYPPKEGETEDLQPYFKWEKDR